ncbi:unnamed protein product [Linum trigynum]|uniref:Uncharacterized protein n=1 Tax=Linum trigynum TaxID=586398 RepID=A0AAV2DQP9_9ROSI
MSPGELYQTHSSPCCTSKSQSSRNRNQRRFNPSGIHGRKWEGWVLICYFIELEIDSFAGSGAETSSAARDDEDELILEAIARLPSEKRDRYAVLRRTPSEAQLGNGQLTETIDLHKLIKTDRELLVKKALATNSQDNFKLLSAIKSRLDRVGIEVTTVEVKRWSGRWMRRERFEWVCGPPHGLDPVREDD